MRFAFHSSRLPCALILVASLLSLLLFGHATLAISPKIDFIEYRTNQVWIHFDAEPNYINAVQSTELLAPNGLPVGPWSNVYVAPNYPFMLHYIIVDTNSPSKAKRRYYRLNLYR